MMLLSAQNCSGKVVLECASIELKPCICNRLQSPGKNESPQGHRQEHTHTLALVWAVAIDIVIYLKTKKNQIFLLLFGKMGDLNLNHYWHALR